MAIPGAARQRCVICKQTYPLSKFDSSKSPACRITAATQGTTIIDLPHGVCSEHVSRLTKVERTKAGGRNEWCSIIGSLCLDCGMVKSWNTHSAACRSTSTTPVRVYTRYLNNATECKTFTFWRQSPTNQGLVDAQGRGPLMVKEECRNANGAKYTIDMTVRGMSNYVLV